MNVDKMYVCLDLFASFGPPFSGILFLCTFDKAKQIGGAMSVLHPGDE